MQQGGVCFSICLCETLGWASAVHFGGSVKSGQNTLCWHRRSHLPLSPKISLRVSFADSIFLPPLDTSSQCRKHQTFMENQHSVIQNPWMQIISPRVLWIYESPHVCKIYIWKNECISVSAASDHSNSSPKFSHLDIESICFKTGSGHKTSLQISISNTPKVKEAVQPFTDPDDSSRHTWEEYPLSMNVFTVQLGNQRGWGGQGRIADQHQSWNTWLLVCWSKGLPDFPPLGMAQFVLETRAWFIRGNSTRTQCLPRGPQALVTSLIH